MNLLKTLCLTPGDPSCDDYCSLGILMTAFQRIGLFPQCVNLVDEFLFPKKENQLRNSDTVFQRLNRKLVAVDLKSIETITKALTSSNRFPVELLKHFGVTVIKLVLPYLLVMHALFFPGINFLIRAIGHFISSAWNVSTHSSPSCSISLRKRLCLLEQIAVRMFFLIRSSIEVSFIRGTVFL